MQKKIRLFAIAALTFALGATASHGKNHRQDNGHKQVAFAAIGGITVAKVFNQRDHHATHEVGYRTNYRCAPNPNYYHGIKKTKSCGCNGGHYKKVQRRVWIPGGWGYRLSDCGNFRTRYYQKGYWSHRTHRVWVAGHAKGCRHH